MLLKAHAGRQTDRQTNRQTDEVYTEDMKTAGVYSMQGQPAGRSLTASHCPRVASYRIQRGQGFRPSKSNYFLE